MSKPSILRDVVGVRPHPTVVRLDHLDAEGAGWITESYHTTPELERHLAALRNAFARPSGCGAFLIGQYGAGKSHFLAYLVQALREGRLAERPPHVTAVSLLNFRGDAPLEDVVGDALGVPRAAGDRRVGYDELDARHPDGEVLVLDELSEFLRSKPDHRRFTEDVRFLQFLGEWAQGRRFFVIAAMQEQIEHTGDLERGLYRKIKDRYPIRLLLTPSHVRDLVAEAILVRGPACAEVARRVADDVLRAQPAAAIDRGELEALYPIHPATLDVLEEVRDRFSQTRGVVDFVVTRLAGDKSRGVEPFLDRPVTDLLTPEHVVDHFQDLLRVQPEFLAVAQKVLPWVDRHLAGLFDKPARAVLAGRLVKLLVLAHLSPAREGIRAAEGAAWLLVRASKVDPDRNVDVVRRTLDALAERGRYVVRDGDVYRLDLAHDDVEEFERGLRAEVAACEAHDERVFDHLAPLLAGRRFDPTALPDDEIEHRALRWRFHERRYAVFAGHGMPPTPRVPLLVVRPVHGDAVPCADAFTFVPRRLRPEGRHFEQLALTRLRAHGWSEETARRLEQRITEGVERLEEEFRSAFLHGDLVDPKGQVVPVERVGPDATFPDLLERVAERMFQRIHPGFERFAPLTGPLPKETLRRFAAFAAMHDLDAPADDDAVDLVREAYLVPMGVLARQGRGFTVPAKLEGRELPRLLLPLFEHRPAPTAVFEALAQPVYGLVPDQAYVLLLAFVALGEIDLVKEGKSFRELHALLPDPRQYDAIEPAEGLAPESLGALERLAAALRLKVPARWNVAAQRRVVGELAERARELAQRVEPRLLQLSLGGGGAGPLVERARETLAVGKALGDGDEVEAFETFLGRVGTIDRFLAAVSEASSLPDRLERVVREVERHRHLFATMPAAAREELLAADSGDSAVADPGEPPEADALAPLEEWLERARAAYGRYAAAYREAHDAWWSARENDPVRGWRAPSVARSRHLALGAELERLDDARRRAAAAWCRGCTGLDYQPLCRCGFDGAEGPVDAIVRSFAAARSAVASALRHFFAQDAVRERVRALVEDGVETGEAVRRYIDGDAPWPDVADVARFDAHLAGVGVVRRVSGRDLLAALGGGPRTREELHRVIDELLDREASEAKDVVVDADVADGLPDEVAAWCLRQALRHGVPLPKGLFAGASVEAAVPSLDPRSVGAAAVQRLGALALPDPVVVRVASWLVEGRVPLPPPREDDDALLTVVRELRAPTSPEDPAAFASLAAALYAATPRMLRVDRAAWLARLCALADVRLDPPPPPLADVLKARADVPWLVLDAFSAPLCSVLLDALPELLGGRGVEEVTYAWAPEATTTDAFYRGLVEGGAVKGCVKVDSVDHLIHERAVPFDDLVELARAELRLALRGVASRLDPAQPLLVFADHGFRLAEDGRGWEHGGPSTPERLVPVVRMGRG